MERQDDIIIFDESEQADFSAPASTTPADAIEIAANYRDAALTLQARVNAEQQDNPRDWKTVNDLRQRAERARKLMSFASRVDLLCAPEIIESMVPDELGPTDLD